MNLSPFVNHVSRRIERVIALLCVFDGEVAFVELQIAYTGVYRVIQDNVIVTAVAGKYEVLRIAQTVDAILVMIPIGVPVIVVFDG